MNMIFPSTRSNLSALVILAASALVSAPNSFAQYAPQSQPAAPATPAAKPGAAAPAEAAKADPEEEKSYKTFTDIKQEDADKRIQSGEQYLQKYPNGKYSEQVYAQLTNSEYTKQDMPKMYADADKALALNPDDVTVLVLIGWVIPHNYDPNDIGAEASLDKGEKYEKHALLVLSTLPKPANLTDDQFAKAKVVAESQAHSGLGLIAYRRQNMQEAADELKKATADPSSQDPTDFYVLGMVQSRLKNYADATTAFQKCAQTPGPVQDRCKTNADAAKKQAAAAPAPPK